MYSLLAFLMYLCSILSQECKAKHASECETAYQLKLVQLLIDNNSSQQQQGLLLIPQD